jgi:4-hydroxy-2-oxoheptanedioate aldolase
MSPARSSTKPAVARRRRAHHAQRRDRQGHGRGRLRLALSRHGKWCHSLEACAQISTAALDAGIAPIARVTNGEYAIATRALDNGALGIVMPHVDAAAEAKKVVNRLKYPPVGHCSTGGIGPQYGLRSASSREAAAALNAANLTVVMLETPTAIANAEEIAAVPGIDVLLISTNDLCAEMGIHGDFGNERVGEAYRTPKLRGFSPGLLIGE